MARILVIDDDAPLGRLATRILSKQFEVVWEQDPRRALDRLDAGERFDAVLCDHLMPDMSGIEVYARVAHGWPELAPRFMLSSGLDRGSIALPPTFAGHFLPKPYSMAEMRSAVEALIVSP